MTKQVWDWKWFKERDWNWTGLALCSICPAAQLYSAMTRANDEQHVANPQLPALSPTRMGASSVLGRVVVLVDNNIRLSFICFGVWSSGSSCSLMVYCLCSQTIYTSCFPSILLSCVRVYVHVCSCDSAETVTQTNGTRILLWCHKNTLPLA